MSKTIKNQKFVKRDSAAMTLAYGGFKNSHHGDLRKEESKDSCRNFKFNNNNQSED